MWIKQQELVGRFVTLEPLAESHIGPLQQAVADGEPGKLWFAHVPAVNQMADYVAEAIAAAAHGDVPYAVRSTATGEIVGTTRYYNVDAPNRRALIGYTWYADCAKRTPVNTECKLLLLAHLFEQLNAIAAEFRLLYASIQNRLKKQILSLANDGGSDANRCCCVKCEKELRCHR